MTRKPNYNTEKNVARKKEKQLDKNKKATRIKDDDIKRLTKIIFKWW